ncbi:Y-family DNA polymerase [Stakelama marina]|uniref:Y-family DNA polymerase n=1 Tax=Stakelama marina TaxID=2826939 RepID=UPI0024C3CD5F|nr:DNA polymerase Y family protein [Stakelama marina]
MTKAVSKRRYLAAYLPHLSAERIARTGAAPPDTPFALVEKKRGAMRITALSPAALALGLAPGMALADARARVPELPAHPHDRQADAALLAWLADACERYTPMVATKGEAGLILDLTGCGPSFRQKQESRGMEAVLAQESPGFRHDDEAERAIARDLADRLSQQQLTARLAFAATPDTAYALACFAGSNPHDLPVQALALDESVHIALMRAGLRTIGDLAARPRTPLAARFGTELPTMLARLLEEEDVRITPRRKLPPVVAERRFAEPMMTTGPLLGRIAELAGEACDDLRRRGQGGRHFGVALFRVDGHVARLSVETGAPTRTPAAIERLFHERLDALADPLDPGFGYDMLRFAVLHAETLDAKQDGLADRAGDKPDPGPLFDRLAVRFGAESVRRFHPRDHHFPEYAATTRPARAPVPQLAWHRPEPGEPPLRPLTLFDPPQAITVLAEVPDGPPYRFQWKGRQHRVTLAEGPERLAYPWWRHPEGKGPTRDYYRVEDEQGHRFWVFRHGLFGEQDDTPDWYLHGLFA